MGDPYATFGGQFGNYRDWESDLILCGHRYYHAGLGRWMSRDPIGYAGGLNLYAYCNSNPINFADPTGFCSSAWWDQWHNALADANTSVKGWLLQHCNDTITNTAVMSAFDLGTGVLDTPASLMNIGNATGAVWDSHDPLLIAGALGADASNTVGFALGAAGPMASVGEAALGRVAEQATGALEAEAAVEAASAGDAANANCFVAGTLVSMADGTVKPIEQVKEGDIVSSRDADTGKSEAKRVTQTFQRDVDETLVLTFEGGERIATTLGHPFYVEGKGFVYAGQLAIGNAIVTRAGPSVRVTGIEHKKRTSRVYNFTVEGTHTYFVGKANGGFWVHNNSYVTLFRAVGAEERADILANRTLRAGNGSMSGKWLAESLDDAAAWGRQFFQHDSKPFDIAAIRFRASTAEDMFRVQSLDNIGPARYLNLDNLNPSSIRGIDFVDVIPLGK